MADGGDGIQSRASGKLARRCVIWVSPESAPPSRLLAGLSRRHVPATVLTDAPSVMFDLSLPGDAQGAGVLALIVVEPARQPHLKELLAAVQTYYPQLPVWQYRPGPTHAGGGLAPLAEGMSQSMSADEPADAPAATEHNGTSHNTRGQPARPPHPKASTDGEADDEASDRRALRLLNDEPHEPMLTAEELEMLLGPLPHEEPPHT